MRFLVAVMLLYSASARAEEDVERSRAHYAAGVSYFDAGDYAKALGEFESAAKFLPRPEFVFNIARCHEMMGEPEQAIARFKHYLELRPNAQDRPEVEERMERLQKRLDEQRARQIVQPPPAAPAPQPIVSPPPITAAPADEKPRKKSRVGLWVGIGIGAAVVVVGVVTLGVVLGRRDRTDYWMLASTDCRAPCTVEDLR